MGRAPRVGSDGWFDSFLAGLRRSQKAFARSGCSQQAATAQGEGRTCADGVFSWPATTARRTKQSGAEAASVPAASALRRPKSFFPESSDADF